MKHRDDINTSATEGRTPPEGDKVTNLKLFMCYIPEFILFTNKPNSLLSMLLLNDLWKVSRDNVFKSKHHFSLQKRKSTKKP